MIRPAHAAIPALYLALGAVAAAQPDFGFEQNQSAEQLVPVRVVADVETVHPGETFHLAAVFTIAPGWHIYWENPGMAGLPTEVEVEAPGGFQVGPLRYTRPREFDEPDGLTYGYEKEAVLFVPVTAPADLGDGTARFEVSFSFLVCKGICLMGRGAQVVTVPTTGIASAGKAPDRSAGDRVAKHRVRLPRPIRKLESATVEFDGRTLRVRGPAGGHDRAGLYTIERPGVSYGKVRSVVENDRFDLSVPVEVDAGNALGEPMVVRAIVVLGRKLDDPCYALELPIAEPGP